MVAEMALVLGGRRFGLAADAGAAGPPAELQQHQGTGDVLYTEYVYPFEIAAVILLVAIVAAIALTLRRRPDSKYQDPGRAGSRAQARTASASCRCRREAAGAMQRDRQRRP